MWAGSSGGTCVPLMPLLLLPGAIALVAVVVVVLLLVLVVVVLLALALLLLVLLLVPGLKEERRF